VWWKPGKSGRERPQRQFVGPTSKVGLEAAHSYEPAGCVDVPRNAGDGADAVRHEDALPPDLGQHGPGGGERASYACVDNSPTGPAGDPAAGAAGFVGKFQEMARLDHGTPGQGTRRCRRGRRVGEVSVEEVKAAAQLYKPQQRRCHCRAIETETVHRNATVDEHVVEPLAAWFAHHLGFDARGSKSGGQLDHVALGPSQARRRHDNKDP
jgi:hypothetical protein